MTNTDGSVTEKKDILPPQKIDKGATGDNLIKEWGTKTRYETGSGTVQVRGTVREIPSSAKHQADGSYLLRGTHYWVNELKKIDAAGNTYEYSIRETLDRAGEQPVEKDDPDKGLIGYTSKDTADWNELSTAKQAGSAAFSGKDSSTIEGQAIDRYNGEVKNTLKKIDVENQNENW